MLSASKYRRHGSRVRLSISGPTSASPVCTAEGRPVVSSHWPGVYSDGITASRFGVRASFLCQRFLSAGLPVWNGPGLARSLQAPDVYIYINVFVSTQTGFYPLIGSVALADTRKLQPPIDYRPRADLRKPPLRQEPSAAYAGLARRVRQGARGPNTRQKVP
ncbi:hypothetical protein DPMN_090048 [Dreissena polymorpha]|uniref:Uncharacterized protein n=1 Tax=Dreissena polymorpha TaxID=45954 RepID=A0A9D4KX06_DREPO|nr:hypothetical protein DPMN_090048 [Dreissena polymorpha]